MKKCIFLGLILILLLPASAVQAGALAPSAVSAVLIDGSNGRVLFEKNAHEKRAPASTTKIMTACLAIESGNLNDLVTVSVNAARIGGSSMYLSPNEKVKFEHLLFGIMLNSGNDASTALAEHIAGSSANYAKMMTDKAHKIGALNTQFKNPHGLDQNGHYTTAYDLAIITKYAMENQTFREIVKTKVKNTPWEGRDYERVLRSKNKLLSQFPGANGVKTGFTNNAGRCLVSSAERNGQHLIAVVLNCSNMWEDSKSLLQYGFDNFKPCTPIQKNQTVKTISIENGTKSELKVIASADLTVYLNSAEITKITPPLIEIPNQLSAPIQKGQTLGYARIIYQGKQLGKVSLIASESIEQRTYIKPVPNSIFNWLINLIKAFG